jgi:UDP-glucuronate 4-epimerase
MKEKILITGVAGFVGFSLALKLLKQNKIVHGLDNINNYYDVKLKEGRLKILKKFKKFFFYKIDIRSYSKLDKIFKIKRFTIVYNLAAQAGVRFSLKKPREYIESNIYGFFNILELSKNYKVKHLVYASSSSVYGANTNLPFSEKKIAVHPIQLYAATKLSNEIMAHSYSALYNLPTSGIRFFSVYGPWGRPDQALFIFTKSILEGKKINLFNYGNHSRDFTYIDDLINGIIKVGKKIPKYKKNIKRLTQDTSKFPYEIYNLGSNKNVKLMTFLKLIEKYLNKKAKLNLKPLQKGDVINTSSNLKKSTGKLNYLPKVKVETGILKFIRWYTSYYNLKI